MTAIAVIPVGALVAQMMASVRANGGGSLGHSALSLGVARLSGKDTSSQEGSVR